jgi:hypothetical protein
MKPERLVVHSCVAEQPFEEEGILPGPSRRRIAAR